MIRKRVGQLPPGQEGAAQDTTGEADEIWNQIFKHTLQSPKKIYIQFADRRGTIIYRSYNLGTDSLVFTDTVALNATILTTGWLNGEPVRIALATRQYLHVSRRVPPGGGAGPPPEPVCHLPASWSRSPWRSPSSAGSRWPTSRSQPVDDITTRARRITAENLDQTLPVTEVDDEIGRLTLTINEMIRRLHDSFAPDPAVLRRRITRTADAADRSCAGRSRSPSGAPKRRRGTGGCSRAPWRRSSA